MNFTLIKRNTKKLFLLPFFISSFIALQAQTDSFPRHHFSFNIAAGIHSGEVGFYYDVRVSKLIGLQLSYGHRFYSFNFIENGGSGLDYKYLAQQGDVARVGVKLFFTSNPDVKVPSSYFLYRVSVWKLHTPTYITRDGSNGLNGTSREVISVDKEVVNFAVGVGKEFHIEKHFYIDLFVCIGVSAGKRKVHKYYYGYSDPYQFKYPDNTYETYPTLFPTLELGFKLGIYR